MGIARLTFDPGHNVAFDVFVNNFTNNAGYTGGSNVQIEANFARYRNVARPRTVGLTARLSFK